MPCHFSRRCRTDMTEVETTSDGVELQSWRQLRRTHLRMLRKQTRTIVLLMALMEAMRVGPVQIVYAGHDGHPARGPDDFGIAYNVGYFLSWLYVCLFMIVFVPLFSWWVPNTPQDPENPSTVMKVADYLKKLNMILLPIIIGFCLIQHLYYTICTLIYVDARPVGSRGLPKNTRKNWLIRLMLLCGIAMSLTFGYGSFQILDMMDLAHVKKLEYLVIVVPIQINFGLLFGSGMQYKMEQRIARKKLAAKACATEATITSDEKQALLEV